MGFIMAFHTCIYFDQIHLPSPFLSPPTKWQVASPLSKYFCVCACVRVCLPVSFIRVACRNMDERLCIRG